MTDADVARAADLLETTLRGRLVRPDADEYDEVRALHNAMIDKRPALIAQCVDVADVVDCVDTAREQGLTLAIRGGAHNGAGLGSADGGLVIDLSEMDGVLVDPDSRTARVEGGARIADLDHAAGAFGLATPAGVIGSTGIAGLTLGGGHGHLTRKLGLTIDNLLSADVVLADGSFVTADARSEPELFWALRGGGGNFGVVTSFTLRLHPVHLVQAGPMLWHLDRSEEILNIWKDFIRSAPRELNGFYAFLSVPPVPQFPQELHLQKMCGIIWCSTAPPERTDELLAPMRGLDPVLDGVMEMPYPTLNSAFDELYAAGDQWYWRADFVKEIPLQAARLHADHGARMPTWKSTMHMYPIDGAPHDVASDETAFSYRDANWSEVIAGVDPDPASADALRDWCIDYWEALHPYSEPGAYVNFMMEEGQERVQASYRDNYARLTRVKAAYDPLNLFRVNQNISPATGVTPRVPTPRLAEERDAARR